MGQHILVVDDDSEITQALQELLESEGFTVDTAWDGASALSMLKRHSKPPDVILLDLMMPEMDGFQFIQELRQAQDLEWKEIPIVVVTAKDLSQEDRTQLNGYVEKIIQKGGQVHSRESLMGEIRSMVAAYIQPASAHSESQDGA